MERHEFQVISFESPTDFKFGHPEVPEKGQNWLRTLNAHLVWRGEVRHEESQRLGQRPPPEFNKATNCTICVLIQFKFLFALCPS